MRTHIVQRLRAAAIRAAVGTALLLAVPWIAMHWTDEVNWSPLDFAVAGTLLFGTGLGFALVASGARDGRYRLGAGLALAAALVLVWASLAVGLVGDVGDPRDLLYVGVLAVGGIGAWLAHLRPRGMACAMAATATAQGLVAAFVPTRGTHGPAATILVANGFFIVLFLASAVAFLLAARGHGTVASA